MLELVKIKFERTKTVSEFISSQLALRIGDRCVVATDRGVELGLVLESRQVENVNFNDSKIHRALRKATERDLYLQEKNKEREDYAYDLCRKRIRVRNLEMKLSGVEYVFDGSRVIFYFTSDKRVDFRKLVKDLARALKTRIEMRQIGARDEAKLIGGLGSCGTGENCSSKFLQDLRSVTVKTVKSQELGMNPTRLSSLCGRLKCCLNFEINGD